MELKKLRLPSLEGMVFGVVRSNLAPTLLRYAIYPHHTCISLGFFIYLYSYKIYNIIQYCCFLLRFLRHHFLFPYLYLYFLVDTHIILRKNYGTPESMCLYQRSKTNLSRNCFIIENQTWLLIEFIPLNGAYYRLSDSICIYININ